MRTYVRMSYVELHCHSAYSFLDGASLPVELVAVAAEQGYPALALTDHDGLHGAMEFAQAAKPLGLRAITGAELTLDDGSHLTLLCRGPRGLSQPLPPDHARARGHARATRPSRCRRRISLDDVERHAEGLVCLSGCARDGALAGRIERREHAAAAELGRRLLRAFGPERLPGRAPAPVRPARPARATACWPSWPSGWAWRAWPPATCTRTPARASRCRTRSWPCGSAARSTSRSRSGAATPRTCSPRRRRWPSASPSIRRRCTSRAGWRSGSSSTSPATSATATPAPRTARRTAAWRRSAGSGSWSATRTARRSEARVAARGGAADHPQARAVGLLPASPRHARAGARGGGRGARARVGARAAAARPRARLERLLDRLLPHRPLAHRPDREPPADWGASSTRRSRRMPDIDLDFPRDIREVLIPRVHRALRRGSRRARLHLRLPTARAARCATSPRRWGCRAGEVERVARSVDPWSSDEIERDMEKAIGGGVGKRRIERSPRWRALVALVQEAHGLPRHVSQHPGGMVISTAAALIELCPIQPAAMTGRQLVQWDKDSCSDAGFLKIDLLGLGMLSAVERCVVEIAHMRGERIDLSRIPYDDPAVYRSIQRAETTGVFQIESRAQMQMLRRTLPAIARRPHRAGRAGASRADPRRRGAPLHRAAQAAARRPGLPGALRAPVARAGAERHARHDRLPGPGDRDRDGVRRLLARARPRGCGGR